MLTLVEPTLLLDKVKCLQNIHAIVAKAVKHKVVLRPHFKTHQSHTIGGWFRDAGVSSITVSSLKMAEYFAADGWKDITVAFPLNIHEADRINYLTANIQLNVLVVDAATIDKLAAITPHTTGIFIEVDTGYHRTGINPADIKSIDAVLTAIQKYPHMQFKGFLAHAGHSYKLNHEPDKLTAIHTTSISPLIALKKKYLSSYPDLIISTGDTPTCSLADDFTGVDEIRPGNLVFYDLAQHRIGSCRLEQIAIAMACPVVASYPERNEIIIYGGAVHFSKDYSYLPDGTLHYGKVVKLHGNGWEITDTGMYIKSLSQEHGIVHAPKELAEKIRIGDFIGVLPIHACLTANEMKAYTTLEGEKITRL